MSKDPAFLFYTSDFMTGVQFMSLEERGAYITLLAAQHQHGHLDPKRVGFLLGFGWDMLSDAVREKFSTDENGLIFNERLEIEIEKRAQYIEKQTNNGLKGGRPRKEKNPKETQTKPKGKPKQNPTENDNDNENTNSNGKGVVGEKPNNTYMLELSNNQIWIEQTCIALKIDASTIRLKLIEATTLFDARGENHPNMKAFQSHFVNWLREELKKPKSKEALQGKSTRPTALLQIVEQELKQSNNDESIRIG